MIKNISNLGDAALYCDFGTEVNKQINSEVIKCFNNIREKNIKGINNLTPSYNKLIISYDLKVTNFKEVKDEIEKINESKTQKITNKNLEIPVCCDASFSLDIERLEKKLNLNKDEILEEEFEKLDDKFKPDEDSFYATKQVFEAYITDKSFREIIDSGKFNELHVHPSGNYFIKLPEELRSKIPAYIKKNIDLERFIDA